MNLTIRHLLDTLTERGIITSSILPLRPILIHAGFVFWLMAFPFEGLLINEGDPLPSLAFLVPHAITLILLGQYVHCPWFSWLTDRCIFILLCLTLFFPYFQQWAYPLLALTGVCGAVLPIRLGLFHTLSPRPILSAALGQSLGVGLLFILPILPLPIHAQFILVALPLLLFRERIQASIFNSPTPTNSKLLTWALPVIFLFFMTSGLTHGLLVPCYHLAGPLPGLELFFYVACVVIGFRLAEFRIHLPLTLAIVLAMFAFGIWQSPDRVAMSISMYAMNSSKGFADIFLLALMLGQRDVARSFSLGIGVMLLGMSGGIYLAHALGHQAWAFVLVGNILVCATVLVFFFQGPRKERMGHNTASSLAQPATGYSSMIPSETAPDPWELHLARGHVPQSTPEPPFMGLLSPQERNVLALVLSGSNYKQVAESLSITESSVKTYMCRVCTKAETRNKSELLKKYFSLQPSSHDEPTEDLSDDSSGQEPNIDK
jgi:DNA-binding CsgD family transcriptional regulator